MRFKVKGKKEEKGREPVIELWLEQAGDSVFLNGRDKRGEENFVMEFRRGRFYRAWGVNLEGIETDAYGRIKEEE